jgi:hypothetical protein
LNINDTTGRGQVGSLLGDTSRKDEVKRLAQGVAAEQFGAGQQQQFQNGNSAYVDSARISDEAIEEISRSGNANEIQRTDQLVSALRGAFESKTGQQGQSGAGQQGDRQNGPDAVGGADGAQPGKKMEKKRTTHWEPASEAGQIHPEGREVIGRITIKEEVREVDDPKAAAKNTGGGSGGNSNSGSAGSGAPQSGSPNTGNSAGVPSTVGGVGKGQSSGNSAAKGDRESQKKMDEEGKADKEGAAASQSLKNSGLQAPGMEQGAENYEVGEKSKDFDVRSPATGASQTLTMRGAGELKDSENILGTYKRLDDSPALKYASLHSRGENLDRSAERYAQQATAQGESSDQVVKNVESLKKTTPDQ